MILNTKENIEKAQKVVEKLNGNFVNNFIKAKEQRHVKEQNEPVLEQLSDNFRNSYAKDVVASSMKDVVKELRNHV